MKIKWLINLVPWLIQRFPPERGVNTDKSREWGRLTDKVETLATLGDSGFPRQAVGNGGFPWQAVVGEKVAGEEFSWTLKWQDGEVD